MSAPRFFATALALATLAACGGGGDSNTSSALDQVGSTAPATGSTPDMAGCPTAKPSDVWMDQRLGCMTVGTQIFLDNYRGYATSTTVFGDRSFPLGQIALDKSFNNILSSASYPTRYWANFLCVKDGPRIGNGNGYSVGIAADVLVAMGLGAFSPRTPAGIGATTISLSGGGKAGSVDIACDPAIHPLIVDFNTGKIVSINPAALASLNVYTAN